MTSGISPAKRTLRTVLGISALLATLYTSACGTSASSASTCSNVQADPAAQEYVLTGKPLSAASNCYGQYGAWCDISLTLKEDDGNIVTLITPAGEWEQEETTSLESAINGAINNTKIYGAPLEDIEVFLDNNYMINMVRVDGTIYQD